MHKAHLTDRLRTDDGFTLIEMLVAMSSATVIMIAMVAMLIFTTNQASRITERVQADQIGRTAMTRITDDLHSSCTGFGTDAIQGPTAAVTSPLESTGPLSLWFISAYGSSSSGEAIVKPVYLHNIKWEESKTGKKLGTLTDYRFESKSGSGPTATGGKYEFLALKESNAKKILLAKNVIPQTISGTPTIFQYYKLSGKTGAFSQITEQIPAEATANAVAKVSIGFTQAPESGETKLGRTVPFDDAVVLRLNPTETGEHVTPEPCS
jgi:type II secretory pathway pseudopilin PulG